MTHFVRHCVTAANLSTNDARCASPCVTPLSYTASERMNGKPKRRTSALEWFFIVVGCDLKARCGTTSFR